MHAKLSNKVVHKFDVYGKDEDYGSQFLEELQDAFNSTMHSKNMPSSKHGWSSFSLLLILDDDKVHYNYLLKKKVKVGQESKLKHVRHVRDNMNGFTNHVVSYASSDIPIASHFEHEEESLFDCAMDLGGFFPS